jgi:DNA transformation protein and related proteins
VAISKEFADYCCELLSTLGPCSARRMFGGWGLHLDGLTVAILADLSPKGTGQNARLYLKADDGSRARYEAAGCQRFAYPVQGVVKTMNYYTAPDEAMESPEAMQPWAHLALTCALTAKAKAPVRSKKPAAAKSARSTKAKDKSGSLK